MERMIVLFKRIFIVVLGCFATPLFAQDPILSDLYFLPDDAVIAAAAGDQETPVITRGGDKFLVVWVDSRTDLIGNIIADEGARDIYALRTDASGTLLGATPLVISQAHGDQTKPRVAWNGQNWLVVWITQVPTQFFYTDQIAAARVSSEGVVLDTTPIEIETFENSGNGEFFGVASDGSNWGVVWKDFVGTQWKIQGVRISPQGITLDLNPVLIHTTTSQPYQGDIAFAQDEYLLAWKEWRFPGNDDVLGRRLNTLLQPLETNAIAITSHADYDTFPKVATNGTDFLVTWERYNTCCVGGGGKVYGARVSHGGSVLDPASIAISGYVGETIGRNPSVTWDGLNYYVGWVVGFDLFAARVTSNGGVMDFGGFTVGVGTSLMMEPNLAGGQTGGAQMVWKDNRAGGILPYDIYRASLSADGVPAPESAISLGAPAQLEADVQTSGTGYMVVFRSESSGLRRIMAQPLDANGDPLVPEPILLASGAYLSSPALAWNGSLYYVVWASTDVSMIYGRRIAADGTLIDGAPIQIMSGITPDVAALGDTFLVVGTHNPSYFEFRHPFSVRVRGSDGAILDATPRQLGQYFAQNPSVSVLGNRWLATWQRNMSHDDPDANINAAFINADGTSTAEFIVSGTFSLELYTPAVATSGANALIVWRDSRNGYSNIDIRGRLVLPNGTMLSEIPITSASSDQFQPEVCWDGNEYVVVYQDKRNEVYFLDERSDVYATRITGDGVLIDADGFSVENASIPEVLPATAGGGGVAILMSSVFQSQNPMAAYRIGYRFLGLTVGQAPVVSDIPDQAVAPGGRFQPIRADNYVSDPDDPDSVITWSWSGNTGLRVSLDPVRRRIRVRAPNGWVGSETITFTATDLDGLSDSDNATFTVAAGVVSRLTPGELEDDVEVVSTELEGNYPNPFNPTTTIRYALSEASYVTLSVYNLLGERVALLVDGMEEAGQYEVVFGATNLASGMYLYRMNAGDFSETRKFVITR